MSSLSDEWMTLRYWFSRKGFARRERRDADRRAEDAARATFAERMRPRAVADTHSAGHDPDPDTVCSCRKVRAGEDYRQHLLSVLDNASALRTPPYMRGEGW